MRKSLPVPLLTRFTDVFHFRPVNFEILRNLSQKFLLAELSNLKPRDGIAGWEVGFRSKEEYIKFLEVVEREGFTFENQGRSVGNYVKRMIENKLNFLLAQNHIPSGTKVYLVPRSDQTDDVIKKNKNKVLVDVMVEGRDQPIAFEMDAQVREKEPKNDPNKQKWTAAHEAGHNVIMRLALGDKLQLEYLSIKPGVAKILNQLIFYAGLAEAEETERMSMTRQAVIERIAIDFGGSVAQRLVTKGRIDDAGKHAQQANGHILPNCQIHCVSTASAMAFAIALNDVVLSASARLVARRR